MNVAERKRHADSRRSTWWVVGSYDIKQRVGLFSGGGIWLDLIAHVAYLKLTS